MRVIKLVFALLLVSSLAANVVWLARGWGEPSRRSSTQSPALDQFEVIRTKGGLLAVSTIKAPELFQATADHTILGVPVGQTTSQIRVQAIYGYHVELAPEWKVTLRDKTNYVDLTGSARMKWLFRAANLHAVRPVVKLANGTMLVGNRADVTASVGQAEPEMIESEFTITPIRWYTLDAEKVVVTRPGPVDAPDLSKVDEVGFADLTPGGGHGNAGWINIGPFEVYGKPVAR